MLFDNFFFRANIKNVHIFDLRIIFSDSNVLKTTLNFNYTSNESIKILREDFPDKDAKTVSTIDVYIITRFICSNNTWKHCLDFTGLLTQK